MMIPTASRCSVCPYQSGTNRHDPYLVSRTRPGSLDAPTRGLPQAGQGFLAYDSAAKRMIQVVTGPLAPTTQQVPGGGSTDGSGTNPFNTQSDGSFMIPMTGMSK